MSDQAVGNGDSTKQVVETATTVAGTVAIGAAIGFILLVFVPIFAFYQFVMGLPNKFGEIYKTNYPDEYEQLIAKAKVDWEVSEEELDTNDGGVGIEFAFDEADELGFRVMYTILTEGDEENSRQALKEFFFENTIDDEEIAEQISDALMEQVKQFKSGNMDLTEL